MSIICIPGIPIKRESACISPEQSQLPHVVKSYKVDANGHIKFDGFKPNIEDYPEYAFVIQMFIDQYLKDKDEKE